MSDQPDGDRPPLPDGVTRRDFDGETGLATRGQPANGGTAAGDPAEDEAVEGERRFWDPHRSKVAAMYAKGMDLGLAGGECVLYLGAASGTTASHVADFARVVYAVEFAPRPVRDLVAVAAERENFVPLLKDARKPETYAHVVEPVDAVIQDVATRGQARVALANRRYLRENGVLILAVKARSEDVTVDPADVFEDVLGDLREGYEVLDSARLEPFHADHLGVVARPR